MGMEWRDMLLKQIRNPPFIPTHSLTNRGEEWVGGGGHRPQRHLEEDANGLCSVNHCECLHSGNAMNSSSVPPHPLVSVLHAIQQ